MMAPQALRAKCQPRGSSLALARQILGWNPGNSASIYPQTAGAAGAAGATGATGAGAAQTNPIDMRQAYLDALSNPGHVTTPEPMCQSPTPPAQQPNVLQSFLANNQGSTGAGGYSNMPFFNTLKGLRAGAG